MNAYPAVRRLLSVTMLATGILMATAATPASAINLLPPMAVQVKDTIKGEKENIDFSGQAFITGKVIDDPDTRGPLVLQLAIDFSNVTAVGVSSGRKYISSAQTVVQRPLRSFDPIDVSFPYYPTNDLAAARTALASFAVSFGSPGGIHITTKLKAP
jgi:hypothetical protein